MPIRVLAQVSRSRTTRACSDEATDSRENSHVANERWSLTCRNFGQPSWKSSAPFPSRGTDGDCLRGGFEGCRFAVLGRGLAAAGLRAILPNLVALAAVRPVRAALPLQG